MANRVGLHTISCESLDEALCAIQRHCASWQQPVYRGQIARWPLMPSLRREPNDDTTLRERSARLEHFVLWAADQVELRSLMMPADTALAICQHYGLPTTALDFTRCLKIAAFFATDCDAETAEVQQSMCGKRGSAIYAIDLSHENFALLSSVCDSDGVPAMAIVDVHVPDLWRLKAQMGLFVEWYVDGTLDGWLPVLEVTFPAEPSRFKTMEDEVYPVAQSALERLITEGPAVAPAVRRPARDVLGKRSRNAALVKKLVEAGLELFTFNNYTYCSDLYAFHSTSARRFG